MVRVTQVSVLAVLIDARTPPEDVLRTIDFLSTVLTQVASGVDVVQLIFSPESSCTDVIVDSLLGRTKVMQNPFMEVVINLSYITNKGPVYIEVFDSVPSNDVHDGSFEVLPWHVPDVDGRLI